MQAKVLERQHSIEDEEQLRTDTLPNFKIYYKATV